MMGEMKHLIAKRTSEANSYIWDTIPDTTWVGKEVHWKLYQRLKLNQAGKWYKHKPESTLENGTHKIFWYFDIQTNITEA